MADAMTHIATATLDGDASDYSFKFDSIPGTYKHLRFVIGTASRHNGDATAGADAAVSIGGADTATTVAMAVTAGGSSFTGMGAAVSAVSNYTKIGSVTGDGFWDGTDGGYNGCGILDVYNYASTSYYKPRSYVYSVANGISTDFGLEIGAALQPTSGAITYLWFDSSTGTGTNSYGSTSYPQHVYLFGIGTAA